jgi:predicted DsbA family dithiol-disulfide isomerase
MKVEIWSDVACPWCYIGKRHFESALDQFAHRDDVTITWRSYQLDPDAPRNFGNSLNEMLAQKYNVSPTKAVAMNDRVSAIAAQAGLDYHLDKAQYGNTFDAHRLIQLAATHQLQDQMEERLFKAYFTDGLALTDTETLVTLASEIGIAADEARTTLAGTAYTDEVRSDIQRAKIFGIEGVPFFAVDEQYGISGAQPTEVFKEVLEKVWAESHPLIKIATPTSNTCEGDTCSPDLPA